MAHRRHLHPPRAQGRRDREGRHRRRPERRLLGCARTASRRDVRCLGEDFGDLLRALGPLGLAAHAKRLAPFATLETGLLPSADALTACCTRIGGDPDLAPDTAWPAQRWPLAEVAGWPDYARAEVDLSHGRGEVFADGADLVMPIPFLLHVDLGELDERDPRLPAQGLLSFFAAVATDVPDPLFAKRVASHVLYSPDPSRTAPRRTPPTADAGPASARRLRPALAIRWEIPFEELGALEAERPATAFAALVADSQRVNHALLPAPAEECVGPMPPIGEVALLRVHDDAHAGFTVGDASWLTFAISELDLRARRSERARASVFVG